VELYENIIDKPINEHEDYNDFVNRRRTNKKSIRTKVTTLKEDGEVVSEILGTNGSSNDEFDLSSADGVKAEIETQQQNEVKSNVQNATDDNNFGSGNTKPQQQKDNINPDTKNNSDTKKSSSKKYEENKTVFGMKPLYGYTCMAVIALVGIAATVKILKNKSAKKLILN